MIHRKSIRRAAGTVIAVLLTLAVGGAGITDAGAVTTTNVAVGAGGLLGRPTAGGVAHTDTSGWKSSPLSYCCTAWFDIDGPAHSNYVYDMQWKVTNNDTWGTGNTSFWVQILPANYPYNPPLMAISDLQVPRFQTFPTDTGTVVIPINARITPGRYCMELSSYTYPGGYYSKTCATVGS